jgi:hypothetical protein
MSEATRANKRESRTRKPGDTADGFQLITVRVPADLIGESQEIETAQGLSRSDVMRMALVRGLKVLHDQLGGNCVCTTHAE